MSRRLAKYLPLYGTSGDESGRYQRLSVRLCRDKCASDGSQNIGAIYIYAHQRQQVDIAQLVTLSAALSRHTRGLIVISPLRETVNFRFTVFGIRLCLCFFRVYSAAITVSGLSATSVGRSVGPRTVRRVHVSSDRGSDLGFAFGGSRREVLEFFLSRAE